MKKTLRIRITELLILAVLVLAIPSPAGACILRAAAQETGTETVPGEEDGMRGETEGFSEGPAEDAEAPAAADAAGSGSPAQEGDPAETEGSAAENAPGETGSPADAGDPGGAVDSSGAMDPAGTADPVESQDPAGSQDPARSGIGPGASGDGSSMDGTGHTPDGGQEADVPSGGGQDPETQPSAGEGQGEAPEPETGEQGSTAADTGEDGGDDGTAADAGTGGDTGGTAAGAGDDSAGSGDAGEENALYRADVPYLKTNGETGSTYFGYTGDVVQWRAPQDGSYVIEAIGAGCGGPDGSLIDRRLASTKEYGYGGYARGTVNLHEGDMLYVAVGGAGRPGENGGSAPGGWNGGGSSVSGAWSGGGATAVMTEKLGDGTISAYADRKDALLMVAGGAGGFGSTGPFRGDRTHEAWLAQNGSGGGEETEDICGYFSSAVAAVGAGHDHGYAFGRGEPSISFTKDGTSHAGGAGGGGLYGGHSSTYYHSVAGCAGGSGGTGYLNTDANAAKHLREAMTCDTWAPIENNYAAPAIYGNGEAVINYNGPIRSDLILALGEYATCDGRSGEVRISGTEGSSIDLSEKVTTADGVRIVGWRVIYGDGRIGEHQQTFYFGEEDTAVYPLIYEDFTLASDTESSGVPAFRDHVYTDSVYLQWEEKGNNNDKYYRAFHAVDDGEFEEVSFSTYDHYEAPEASFYLTKKPQTYTAPFTGTYTVYLYGAHGGGDGGASGGMGGYVAGTVVLREGSELTVNVGGAGKSSSGSEGNVTPGGWNGGGQCWWSGSGGGCTEILLGDVRIAAAGSGGGATNGHKATNARLSTVTDHLTGTKAGEGSKKKDAGGGGAGWIGGIMGIHEGRKGACGGYGGINGWDPVYFTVIEEDTTTEGHGHKGKLNGFVRIVPPQGRDIYEGRSALLPAPDIAPPGKPENAGVSVMDETSVTVTWEEPEDNGTIYRHKVVACDRSDDTSLGESNVTEDMILSGTVAYYYYADHEPTGTAGAQHTYTEDPDAVIDWTPDGETLYLHVAAVDRAGNIGPTADVPIEAFRSIEGTVTWIDEGNRWGTRPKEDVITLCQDGKPIAEVTVPTDGDTASYLFEEVPLGHVYTVTQQDVSPYDVEQDEFDFVNRLELGAAKGVMDLSGNDLEGGLCVTGDMIEYRITVHNGTDRERKVTVRDVLPEGTAYETDAESSGETGNPEGTRGAGASGDPPEAPLIAGERLQDGRTMLTITGTVEKGVDRTFAFRVRILPEASGKTLTNSAQAVWEDVPRPVPTNEVSVRVRTSPVKTVTNKKGKDLDGKKVSAGTLLYFAVEIRNDGQDGVLTVSDTPDRLLMVTEIGDGGRMEDGTIFWDVELAGGETAQVHFTARAVNAAIGKTVENRASVTDGTYSEDTNTVRVRIVRRPAGGAPEPEEPEPAAPAPAEEAAAPPLPVILPVRGPLTGDSSRAPLWLAVLAGSCLLMAGAAIRRRRRT